MDNPINISGQLLEDQVESYCRENNITYKRAKTGTHEIDFIIETDKGTIYADCTNQMGSGSVEEKIPHKIWKYYKKYNYKNVTIIKGDHKIGKKVIEHCEDLARVYNFDLNFLSGEQFCNSLTQKEESFFG